MKAVNLNGKKALFMALILILSTLSIILHASAVIDDDGELVTNADDVRFSRAAPPKNARAEWSNKIIGTSEKRIDDVEAGNFLSTNPGLELVVAATDDSAKKSSLELIYGSEITWTRTTIFQADGQIADMDWIGPVDESESEGIVIATSDGGKGTISFVQPPSSGTTWTKVAVDDLENTITKIASGDVAGGDPGMDIICVDSSNQIFVLSMTEFGDWAASSFAQMSSTVVDMIVADVEPDKPGNQLFTIDEGGMLYQVTGAGATQLWKDADSKKLTAVAVGDADADSKMEILVAVEDGTLNILDLGGDGIWKAKNIFKDQSAIRDIVITDMDPFRTGLELAVAGDSQRLTLLTQTGGVWSTRSIYEDDTAMTGLLAGPIDAGSVSVNEIIAINGAGGEVALIEFSGYYSEVIFKGENKMSGVGIGDLDPDKSGPEVFVVGMDKDTRGVVAMAWRDGDSWVADEIFDATSPYTTGELLTPVIGNFDKEAGNELAVVGMFEGAEGAGTGQVTMIKKIGGELVPEQILVYPRFLHGAAIGEFLSENTGDELIVTSFTDKGVGNVSVMSKKSAAEGGGWNTTLVWQSDGHVRKAEFADIDPTHAGDELFVVDKSGNLTMLYQDGAGFYSKHLWHDPGTPGLSRLGTGDADNDGQIEILVGGDSNNVGLVERKSNGEWEGSVIFTDVDKIRGTQIGDFDPSHAGNEIAVYGYSARVTLLTQDETDKSKWNPKLLFTDTGRGHDLAIGEFDPLHEGNELLMSGFSKNLTMLAYYDDVTKPSFELKSAELSKSVYTGADALLNLTIETSGNFNDRIYLDVGSLPAGMTLSDSSSQTLTGPGTAQLTLSISPTMVPGTNKVTVKAIGADMESSLEFTLAVLEKPAGINIVKVTPGPDAKDVIKKDLEIEIEFDTEIDETTLTSENVIIEAHDGEHFKGEMHLSEDGKTLTISNIHAEIDEHEKIPYETEVTVKITTGLKNINGGSLESDYTWHFETAKEEEPGEFGGLYYAIILIIVLIVIIVIIGIVYGRKKFPDEPAEEEREEKKDMKVKKPQKAKK